MKKIELFERAIAEQAGSLKNYGINGTMFWAYRKSIDAENDLIDFNEGIWDEDIDAIAECMMENGITEVNANYTDWQTNKRARIPAIRMTRQ